MKGRCVLGNLNEKYIPTEKRNCEILKLLQIYKNDKKFNIYIDIQMYMLFKIFLRQVHKMVRK